MAGCRELHGTRATPARCCCWTYRSVALTMYTNPREARSTKTCSTWPYLPHSPPTSSAISWSQPSPVSLQQPSERGWRRGVKMHDKAKAVARWAAGWKDAGKRNAAPRKPSLLPWPPPPPRPPVPPAHSLLGCKHVFEQQALRGNGRRGAQHALLQLQRGGHLHEARRGAEGGWSVRRSGT